MIRLTRDRIAALIPHAGAMCLLDTVQSWDDLTIVCLSRRYLAAENPLRRPDGRLATLTGIELAGQAAARHGALTASPAAKPRQGYLASLRDIRLSIEFLDATPADLTITAERLMGAPTGATYRFTVTEGAATFLSGRFTVLFGEQKP